MRRQLIFLAVAMLLVASFGPTAAAAKPTAKRRAGAVQPKRAAAARARLSTLRRKRVTRIKRRRAVKRPARLVGGVRLPRAGDGYEIPDTWADRGLSYGTPELVDMIERVAKRIEDESVDAPLYVADLSPRGGGASAWHRSHKTGRDVDFLFFALDEDGQPAEAPPAMLRFDPDGTADDGRLTFDVARNWELVKALISDRRGRVTHIFVAEPLEQLILDHAAAAGERDSLRDRAAALMRQPGDSAPHDDHFHIRIAPPPRATAAARTAATKQRSRSAPRRGK